MARASLTHQLSMSINDHYAPGVSKHSLKSNPGENEKNFIIHSYKYRENLKDTAIEFGKFAKQNFGIKYAVDLKSDHVKAFLEEKAQTCSKTTVEQYKSRLETLGNMISDTYGKKTNLSAPMPQMKPAGNSKYEDQIRTVAMDRNDYNAFMKAAKPSDSVMAIRLSEAFGLRVSECVNIRNSHIKENSLFIEQSKGGRDREIPITNQHQREVLKELKEWRVGSLNGPILNVKADSVNKCLNRGLERLGITKYNDHKTGIHCIRKMWATERYEGLRKQGMNHKDAWGQTSHELGHSRDREDLFRVYVVKK